jgi:glycosyltransferase involved in cell wall biosynthesis
MSSKIGVVVIGRNEGDRLIRSLDSVVNESRSIVYVDSGSTDQSCEAARERGVAVVQLDMSVPFTAARARNAGFAWLRGENDIQYVQFIDGDCEVVEGWIEAATQMLETHPKVVAVCGWRRERYPDRSIFNRICDVEWRMGTVGSTQNFGGDVMIRAAALAAVDGYDDTVIAAEDDELSVRLRQNQGEILRIDRQSTLHDADMHSGSQWWKRAKRCGYAYALVSSLHGASPERKFVKELRRTWLWGAIAPLMALALAVPTHGLTLIVFGRYPLTALRTLYSTRRRGFAWKESFAWSLSCGLSVFPEAAGVLNFYLARLGNQQHRIIEYKGSQASGTQTSGTQVSGTKAIQPTVEIN